MGGSYSCPPDSALHFFSPISNDRCGLFKSSPHRQSRPTARGDGGLGCAGLQRHQGRNRVCYWPNDRRIAPRKSRACSACWLLACTRRFRLSARTPRALGSRDDRDVWLVLAFLATGLTVTNVVVVLIIYLASRLSGGHEWRRALAAAALLGILSTATAIGLSIAGARVLKEPAPMETTATLANSYTRRPNVERGVRYAAALATSLIGPYPATMPNESALTPRAKSANQLNVQFSYDILPVTAWTWTRIALILGVA